MQIGYIKRLILLKRLLLKRLLLKRLLLKRLLGKPPFQYQRGS